MKPRLSLLAALIGMSGLGTSMPAVADRPRTAPPSRSRQRPKGMRYSGGTGELRASRSKDEQMRRIAAAQAKRERRRMRVGGSSS